ncbi:hypothetical protein CFC21_075703 [Triticum aestivum]|uniref:Uncharacterized protein n=4 Tax=Triticinae TaxID=1648030 RepID=A0A453JJX8_AEGTS|nr:uncharacterized protein LOC109753956 [Aegilops tauschii subsp. strangulata]XP_044400784.1 uncharacterized protein LOC123124183 [Triticum aestivum]KAF7070157.1 hypothetical protein CFC21_075703 [Triticum aestivum]
MADRSNIGNLGLAATVAVVSTGIILISFHLIRRLKDDTKLDNIAAQEQQSKTIKKEMQLTDDVLADLFPDDEEFSSWLEGMTVTGGLIQSPLRRVPRFDNLADALN